eukprot:SAG31_NODE_1211_length_9376_cov_2.931767_2_plen_241_part_00
MPATRHARKAINARYYQKKKEEIRKNQEARLPEIKAYQAEYRRQKAEKDRKIQLARIAEFPDAPPVLSNAQVEEKCDEIVADLDDLLHGIDTDQAIYFGYTAAEKLEEEDFGWLTSRGEPVLRHADGRTITRTQATEEFGFRSKQIYDSSLMVNARNVEIELQRRYFHRELGYARLFREVGLRGHRFDKTYDGKEHKVFIAWSTQVKENVEGGILKIIDTKSHPAYYKRNAKRIRITNGC